MIKLLFVCHGNICRSPMAEFIFRDMAEKTGMGERFVVSSAGVSDEELGNPVYPPAKRILAEHGISCEGKTARRITREDYDNYDLILCMDEDNMLRLVRAYHGDPDGKLHNLLDFAGRIGQEIVDPWYTRDFETAWEDIRCGCLGLLNAFGQSAPVVLDFSACGDRRAFYRVMSRGMLWQEDYGANLDALNDILTGLPFFGSSFQVIMPEDGELTEYAEKICGLFRGAGLPLTVVKKD